MLIKLLFPAPREDIAWRQFVCLSGLLTIFITYCQTCTENFAANWPKKYEKNRQHAEKCQKSLQKRGREERERVFIRHNGSLPERNNVHQCW